MDIDLVKDPLGNDPSGKPHFFSQLLYADFILNNQVRTGWERLPLNLLLEYENNLEAKDHPLDPSGKVRASLGTIDALAFA